MNPAADYPTVPPPTPPTPPTPPIHDGCAHAAALIDLRRRIRHQFADAVSEQRLSIGQAENLLDALDLPPLPYRWTVRLRLAFVCDVTASSQEEAFETAEAVIETAVLEAPTAVEIAWDHRDRDDASRDEIDHSALDT